jgi:ketosteroid isomerase-like protein
MSDRARIEDVIRTAYAARMSGDVEAVMGHFAPNANFSIAGSPVASRVPTAATGAAAVREVMERLVAAFEFSDARIVSMIVEGDRAAVHWSVRVRSPGTGEEAQTELVDLVRLEGDKIISLQQFADTALAQRLLGQ